MNLLEIKNLHASVGGKKILNGITLTINPGEVHAVMGPNGSGKSTLAHILAGRDGYEVTEGKVFYQGKNLLAMPPENRAREGIFLAFQYPLEIPGVSSQYFLKSALNAIRKHRGLPELDAMDFLKRIREKMKVVEMTETLLNRPVNEGFSGGEKKRNEIFQMAVLDPALAILDETDSGLDIDALRIVAGGVNSLRDKKTGATGARGMLVITFLMCDLAKLVLTKRIQSCDGFLFLLVMISTTSPFFKTWSRVIIFPSIFADSQWLPMSECTA